MINIAICDDELLWLESTEQLLREYSESTGIPMKIHTFLSAYDLIEYVDDNEDFDLYILDVVMPEKTGIQVGTWLREADKRGLIIYLTTSKDFALDAYAVQPFHYLIKPVERESLFAILDKAAAILTERVNKAICVKSKNGSLRIMFDDIVYVEYVDRCSNFHLKSGDVVTTTQQRISFADSMQPLLSDERFFRCGASFVLNLYYISAVDKDAVHFRHVPNTLYLPKNASSALTSAWFDYWMERGNNV